MRPKKIVLDWFEKWESGNFLDLPISKNFEHTSPYGTVKGKKEYNELIGANVDKFLGHKFLIHDMIQSSNKVCVRYTATQGDFKLEVSEWHWIKKKKIKKIVAYYNIEEERIKIEE